VLDRSTLLERVGGDTRALAELVRLFLADHPEQLARIRRAIEARDARGLRDAAHALKGAVSNFAAPAATESALRLQRMGDSGDLSGARSACRLLEEQLEQVKRALGAIVSGGGGRAGGRTSRPRRARNGRRR
jgi:HPt (histidine-containing phosphotransfer) domain-containing protein